MSTCAFPYLYQLDTCKSGLSDTCISHIDLNLGFFIPGSARQMSTWAFPYLYQPDRCQPGLSHTYISQTDVNLGFSIPISARQMSTWAFPYLYQPDRCQPGLSHTYISQVDAPLAPLLQRGSDLVRHFSQDHEAQEDFAGGTAQTGDGVALHR